MKMWQTMALAALAWTAACGGAQRESQTPRAEPAARGSDFDDGDTNTASQAEAVPNDATEEPGRLTSATRAFDTALEAEELSCPGAKGHVDAICRIAERICDVSGRQPSSAAQPRHCDEARAECTRSQERYTERCSE